MRDQEFSPQGASVSAKLRADRSSASYAAVATFTAILGMAKLTGMAVQDHRLAPFAFPVLLCLMAVLLWQALRSSGWTRGYLGTASVSAAMVWLLIAMIG